MKIEIQKLHKVWQNNRALENTSFPKISFDDLTNSIISTGPFYYYIIDFHDMSISNVSASINEIHGFDHETVTFNDILSIGHPDDTDFVVKAEAAVSDFFYKNIGAEKLLKYKVNYCLRGKLKNGEYALFNHQAIMLTLDPSGKFGKSLNIHTRIDHLTNLNTYKFSLIGINGEPSFMNLGVDNKSINPARFSKREIDIIKCIADGLSSTEIGEKLFISEQTVKKHRTNIMAKSDCKNTAQLIKTCVLQGLI
jgi:DNA-binding NarL/FixJ family response regulator